MIHIEGVDYLEVSEAAKKLKVKPCTVRKYLREGRLRVARKISRIWLIPAATLNEFARIPRRPGNPGFFAQQCRE